MYVFRVLLVISYMALLDPDKIQTNRTGTEIFKLFICYDNIVNIAYIPADKKKRLERCTPRSTTRYNT